MPADPPEPRLSVVIPTLGAGRPLRRVLDALDAQSHVAAGEVEALVAVDGGRGDAEAAEAAAHGRRLPVRLLRGDRPGAGPARDAGWRAARAALVLFLDDDVVPAPRLAAEHLGWHARHPEEAVAVLGRVRWAPELRVTPFMRWLERGVHFDFEAIDGVEAGWGRFYTANVSVKRGLLARVDGFDPRFPFHYEDLDLGRRMADHGLRLLYNPHALGDHLHAVTLDAYAGRMAEVAAAERRFCAVHPDVEPYFLRWLGPAAAGPAPRGRGARLAGLVPAGVPWLGPRVRASFEARVRRRLAEAFLAGWEAAAGEDAYAGAPSGSRAGSGGSSPGGPK